MLITRLSDVAERSKMCRSQDYVLLCLVGFVLGSEGWTVLRNLQFKINSSMRQNLYFRRRTFTARDFGETGNFVDRFYDLFNFMFLDCLLLWFTQRKQSLS